MVSSLDIGPQQHRAYGDDVLNASKMNVKSGGKQQAMCNTVRRGKRRSMVFILGVTKGLLQVLKERGINTCGIKLEHTSREHERHDDFKN